VIVIRGKVSWKLTQFLGWDGRGNLLNPIPNRNGLLSSNRTGSAGRLGFFALPWEGMAEL
jgi:hypothetical protein